MRHRGPHFTDEKLHHQLVHRKARRTKDPVDKVPWTSPMPGHEPANPSQPLAGLWAGPPARTRGWGAGGCPGPRPRTLVAISLPSPSSACCLFPRKSSAHRLLHTPQSPAWRCPSWVKLPGRPGCAGLLQPRGPLGWDVWVPSSPATSLEAGSRVHPREGVLGKPKTALITPPSNSSGSFSNCDFTSNYCLCSKYRACQVKARTGRHR